MKRNRLKKRTIKYITIVRLVQLFSIAIIALLIIVLLGYRYLFQNVMENKALEISNLVKAGLTSHMKANIMDKRDYFLNEIKNIPNVSNIEIIRSSSLDNQFGKSKFHQELEGASLKNKLFPREPQYRWNDAEGKLKAIIPYMASSNEKLNCLACHNVQDGDILGAVELTLDISIYQNAMYKYAYVFIVIFLIFAILIIFNMFRFIEYYVAQPLLHIIDDGKTAYEFHSDIDSDSYKTQELVEVVHNINDFNHEVLSKEDKLRQKNKELHSLNQEIELTLQDTMIAIGEMEELRSEDTKNHTKRVSKLSALIAKAYGLSENEVKLVEFTSPLHDIGKVGIPDSVLLKPAKLNDAEFEIMKSHAELGYKALKHSNRTILKTAATIAHSHHEKFDGSGYPQGLKGEEIPLFARIVAIVDVVDALLSKRIYKEKWSIDKTREYLEKEKGKHFDPELVEIVLKNLVEYAKLINDLSRDK